MPFFSTYQPHVRFYADLKFYHTLIINLNDLNGRGHYSLISPLHFNVAWNVLWQMCEIMMWGCLAASSVMGRTRLLVLRCPNDYNRNRLQRVSVTLSWGSSRHSLKHLLAALIQKIIKEALLTGAVLALKSSLRLKRKNSSHLFLWLLFRKLKPDFFFLGIH